MRKESRAKAPSGDPEPDLPPVSAETPRVVGPAGVAGGGQVRRLAGTGGPRREGWGFRGGAAVRVNRAVEVRAGANGGLGVGGEEVGRNGEERWGLEEGLAGGCP